MDPETFVKQLAQAAPGLAELTKCGLTGDEASEFIKSFHGLRRKQPLAEPRCADLILELLRNWDLTKVLVGMVRFDDPQVDASGMIRVGYVEADPLVLLPHGEAVVFEFGTNCHLLWHAAKDSSALLDALIPAAQFLGERGVGKIEWDDSERARTAATRCALAAGGDKYSDFYRMLLGADW
jgi:hypothetical protein